MGWHVKENPAWGKMLDVVDHDGKGVAFFQREEDAQIAALALEMRDALRDLLAQAKGHIAYPCEEIERAESLLAKLDGKKD